MKQEKFHQIFLKSILVEMNLNINANCNKLIINKMLSKILSVKLEKSKFFIEIIQHL